MRKRLVSSAVVVAVMAVLAMTFWPRQREPGYQGKKLSQWLAVIAHPDASWNNVRSRAELQKAVTAVRQIGTNALPHLLKWIHERPSKTLMKINRLAAQIPWTDISLASSSRSDLGWLGLRVLGTNATPAVPELMLVANDARSPELSWQATMALANIGEAALPSMVAIMTNRANPNRAQAARLIPEMGPQAVSLIPHLVQGLNDPDTAFAQGAAFALGRLGREPEAIVPALAGKLTDPNVGMRIVAAKALGQYGAQARPAVPMLRTALQDPNKRVSESARKALSNITPEVLSGE